MLKKNKIVICGNFMFPDKNAAGKRVLGLGYIFQDLGYEPVFIGVSNNDFLGKEKNPSREKGFLSYVFPKKTSLKDWISFNSCYIDYTDTIKKIGIESVTSLVLYGSPVLSIWSYKMLVWAQNNKIKVLYDCSGSSEYFGRKGLASFIKSINSNFQNKFVANKADGIIVISHYLNSSYIKHQKKTVIIPPVGKFINRIELKESIDKKIKIIYAGIPFRTSEKCDPSNFKDRLDVSIMLINNLIHDGCEIKFDIYGINKRTYLASVPNQAEILTNSKCFEFYGQQSHESIQKAIQYSDFSLLIRDVNKITSSGFPTKVSESLLLGVPVITNETSDISLYVKDGVNGIIIDRDIQKAFQRLRILLRDKSFIKTLGVSSSQNCFFDYHNFIDSMDVFLKDVL